MLSWHMPTVNIPSKENNTKKQQNNLGNNNYNWKSIVKIHEKSSCAATCCETVGKEVVNNCSLLCIVLSFGNHICHYYSSSIPFAHSTATNPTVVTKCIGFANEIIEFLQY